MFQFTSPKIYCKTIQFYLYVSLLLKIHERSYYLKLYEGSLQCAAFVSLILHHILKSMLMCIYHSSQKPFYSYFYTSLLRIFLVLLFFSLSLDQESVVTVEVSQEHHIS